MSTTNSSGGTVEYVSYAPKRLVLRAKSAGRSVMLLNDKFDPNWKVMVDGQPQRLLRCNYLMRGVEVPNGEHTIEFRFAPSLTGLKVSLVAIACAFVLIGILIVGARKGVESAEFGVESGKKEGPVTEAPSSPPPSTSFVKSTTEVAKALWRAGKRQFQKFGSCRQKDLSVGVRSCQQVSGARQAEAKESLEFSRI